MYEIHGGDMNSLSFYDGGPASYLEDCETIEQSKAALSEWHKQNYAAWIVNKETQEMVK